MNFNKLSRTIFTIVSLCCLHVNMTNALEQQILSKRYKIKFKIMPYCEKEIGKGCCGTLYQHPDDPNKLIKKIGYQLHPKRNELTELDVANLMMDSDVPTSLMKTFAVFEDNNDRHGWYICEKINGCTLGEFKTKIDWEFFCKHWVIGLFEGMEYFRKKVGTIERYQKEEWFALLSDRKDDNIMVYTEGINKNKPVHIDYSSIVLLREPMEYWNHHEGAIEDVAKMLLKKMEQIVEVNEKEKDKYDNLKEYLEKIGNGKMDTAEKNTLQNIIKNIKEITGIA